MIVLDLINLKKIRRALLYLFCVFITLFLQSMVFSQIEILVVKAMFVPALVVAIGFFEGGMWGGVFGVVTGYFCDMAFSANSVLFLVVFAALGFCAGLLADFLVNRKFYSYIITALAALFLTAFCQAAPLWIFSGAPMSALAPVMALQTLWSIPFCVPAYFAVKAVTGHEKEE